MWARLNQEGESGWPLPPCMSANGLVELSVVPLLAVAHMHTTSGHTAVEGTAAVPELLLP